MEKHHSNSSPKKMAPINNAAYEPASMRIGRAADAPRKISREDVSKCISIWARLYHLDDNDTDKGELCMASRPWMWRDLNSLK